MLTKEEKKSFTKEINRQKLYRFNTIQQETKINPSSPVYIFCKLKSEINSQNENGWTPLYKSIIANNLEAMYELLKLGADPNIPNNLGETPLYLSVDSNSYDAFTMLLQYKADCNLAKKNGNTPLHIAAKRNKTSFISELLRNNANPNIINKLYSQTPTHLAIINKVEESTLIEFNTSKADIYNIKDKHNKTPFDYAIENGDQNYINLLKKIFGNNKNNNISIENKETYSGNIPNEIRDNLKITPVKIKCTDLNNSNIDKLSKKEFIFTDEKDLNIKDTNSVISKNINNKDNNYTNSESNNDDNEYYEKNKENIKRKSRNYSNQYNSSNTNTIINNKDLNENKNLNLNTNSSKSYKNENYNTNLKTEIVDSKEDIKNVISDTIKKINITNNSELTSNINISSQYDNNFTKSNNINQFYQNNHNSSDINSNFFDMRKQSFSNNYLKNENKNNSINQSQINKDICDMNPLEMINQVIATSNNSNIFSELEINSINNKNSINDENNQTIQENNSITNNIILNDSLEYSKSNTHILSDRSSQIQNNVKNENNMSELVNIDNINKFNITINEYEDIKANNKNKPLNNNNNQSIYNNFSNINNKENIDINYNNSKINNISTSNNISLNNSKKFNVRNSTNQNELSTIPNSIINGENNASFKKKFYKNNPTQPEYPNEKISKDIIVDDNQNNIDKINTYNNSYVPYPNSKNNNVNNNKTSICNASVSQNGTIFANNSYHNNKSNKFSSLKLSDIENLNNNSFMSKNENKSYELNLCSPQNIPNELLIRLREWLISCDLLCYYNLLIKNDIYNIDLYIKNLKNGKINISYKDIEDIGIKKPGHIFRFLLKLQIDSGVLDYTTCYLIINKFNSNILTTVGLTASTNIIKCCGIEFFKQTGNSPNSNFNNICCNVSNSSLNNNICYNDIFGFLKYKGLMEYKENFIHNGFDQIDYLIIQLFSNFKFTKEILNDYMHIYSEKDKIKVIQKLYEEKKRISLEFGLPYDDKEEEKILNSKRGTITNLNIKEGSCLIF